MTAVLVYWYKIKYFSRALLKISGLIRHHTIVIHVILNSDWIINDVQSQTTVWKSVKLQKMHVSMLRCSLLFFSAGKSHRRGVLWMLRFNSLYFQRIMQVAFFIVLVALVDRHYRAWAVLHCLAHRRLCYILCSSGTFGSISFQSRYKYRFRRS